MFYWKKGHTSNKKEGDHKTPKGIYKIGPLFYRKDKYPNINTNLEKKLLKKKWFGDDVRSKTVNKLIKINKQTKHRHEKIV